MKYLIFLTLSFALTALDQASKLYIHSHYKLGESREILPPIFNFTYIRNSGGAFGVFQEVNDSIQTILFLILPFIAFVWIFHVLINKITKKDLLSILTLSLVFGGGLGNIIDRIHLKYVIDFLDFHTPGRAYVFPTFNLSDTFIVIGVFILAYLAIFHPKKMPF